MGITLFFFKTIIFKIILKAISYIINFILEKLGLFIPPKKILWDSKLSGICVTSKKEGQK